MNAFPKLLAAAAISGIVSCSGVGVHAPASPVNRTMDYTDLSGSYHYSFDPGGTYRVEATGSDGISSKSTGTWAWERRGAKDAVLTLDGTKSMALNFTTDHHANAKVAGDDRPYPADFSGPGGEDH